MDARELTKEVNKLINDMIKTKRQVDYLTQELGKLRLLFDDLKVDVKMLNGGGRNG